MLPPWTFMTRNRSDGAAAVFRHDKRAETRGRSSPTAGAHTQNASHYAGRSAVNPARADLHTARIPSYFGDISRASASIMCVPMRREGQPVGMLSIQSYTPNVYTQDDLRTLQALADHGAGALDASTPRRRTDRVRK